MNREFEERELNTQIRSRRRNAKASGLRNNIDRENNIAPGGRKSGKAKKSKAKAFIIFALAEILVLFMIFSYAYVIKQYSKIQRPDFVEENVKNQNLTVENIKKMEGYWNIAVFGVDSRTSSVGKGNNSDVIMIASINKDTGNIRLVSVFRDSYLNTVDNRYNKINQAYAIGGPELAVKALNRNLDLNITDYITFNWKAVATGINILGGVDVELSKPEFYYINSYITETVKSTGIGSHHLKSAGMNHLDGIQAVAYARLRYMDTDFARTERQRKVIQLAFDKVKKADARTLNDLLGNMLSMVATNLTWQDGLDSIANLPKYKIEKTGGFPFARGDANMGSKGLCVIPQTLESNVAQLHTFLFEDEIYTVSDTVKKISARISKDTGMYNEGKYIEHVRTDAGYIPKPKKKQEVSEETKEETKETLTKERPYETLENGETIWLDETDLEGEQVDGERGPLAPTNIDGQTQPTKPGKESSSPESTQQIPNGPKAETKTDTKPGASAPTKESQTKGPATATKPSVAETKAETKPEARPDTNIAPKPGTNTPVPDNTKPSAGTQTDGPGSVPPTKPTSAPSENGPREIIEVVPERPQ